MLELGPGPTLYDSAPDNAARVRACNREVRSSNRSATLKTTGSKTASTFRELIFGMWNRTRNDLRRGRVILIGGNFCETFSCAEASRDMCTPLFVFQVIAVSGEGEPSIRF